MENNKQIPLSSAEIAFLWTGYQNATLSFYFFKHFERVVNDQDILRSLQSSLAMYDKHIKEIEAIFKKDGFPIPVGLTEHDINLDAPKLFSDNTAIYLLKLLNEAGVMFYSGYLRFIARHDVRKYLNNTLNSYIENVNQIIDTLLSKGFFVRPPQIPYPDSIDFVQKESFLTGWFGERRPIHVSQVAHLHLNIQRNHVAKTLLIGFSQTVNSNDLRSYLQKGIKMADEKIDSFNLFLNDVDLDTSIPSGLSVTTSTKSPYSDKLVLSLMVTIIRYAICFYGEDLSISTRRDLFAFYSKLITETSLYANENIKLAIKLGYLEEEPKAIDHMDIIDKMNS